MYAVHKFNPVAVQSISDNYFARNVTARRTAKTRLGAYITISDIIVYINHVYEIRHNSAQRAELLHRSPARSRRRRDHVSLAPTRNMIYTVHLPADQLKENGKKRNKNNPPPVLKAFEFAPERYEMCDGRPVRFISCKKHCTITVAIRPFEGVHFPPDIPTSAVRLRVKYHNYQFVSSAR
jgi:hypothetical protein